MRIEAEYDADLYEVTSIWCPVEEDPRTRTTPRTEWCVHIHTRAPGLYNGTVGRGSTLQSAINAGITTLLNIIADRAQRGVSSTIPAVDLDLSDILGNL